MPNEEFFRARALKPGFPQIARAKHSAVIPATINKLSNQLVASATATYAKLGLGFFDARYVLFLGRRPNSRASDASRHLKVDPAAVCRAGQFLRSEQIVSEPKGPTRSLTLTKKGRDIHGRIEQIAQEREARLLKGFTPGEAIALMDYLDRLTENMTAVAAVAEDVPAILDRPQS
jgi:DNA-binding MarR family transcriptional regulator